MGVFKLIQESKFNQYVDFNNKRTIYNALSKASISVSETFSIQKIIDSGDTDAISSLKKLGMIVEDYSSEFDTINYLFNKNYFGEKEFLNIVLVPGLDCNFKCPYCFEKVAGSESLFETKLDTYFSLLKQYSEKNFPNYKTIEISLFGGEPLLFSHHIFDYFEHLENNLDNISYFSSIVTNGALLDEKSIQQLLLYKCRSIQITIDGCREIHDKNRIFKNGKKSYDLLIDNINNAVPMLSEECQFNLRINLSNVTVKDVKTTLSDINPLIRKKIKVLFRPVYNTGCFKQTNLNKFDALKQFLDVAIDMGFDIVRNTYYFQACESCSGENFFFIMPDLSIWKCINDINFTQARIGEISKDGTLIINADKLVNWYKYSNCFTDDLCVNCKMLPDCFGGCALYRAKNGHRSCKKFDMAVLPYLY